MPSIEVPALSDAEVSAARAARLFFPHLLALIFPLTALGFVLTGPHSFWLALLFAVLAASE